MNLKRRLLEYVLITSFVWILYLTWLIPFQLYWVGLEWDEFTTWIVWGTVLEFFVAYPLTKIIVYVVPKITRFVENI